MVPNTRLMYVGQHEPQETHVILHIYDRTSYVQHVGYDLAVILDALAENKQVWIDIFGLKNAEGISQWCNDFEIPYLTIEDILHTHQRPKLEGISNGVFIVFKLLEAPREELTYYREQFSMVIQKNLLFTFRETANYELNAFYQHLNTHCQTIRESGCTYLAYLLMDKIVDHYFTFVRDIERSLSDIEDLLMDNPRAISMQALYTIKRRAMVLRNVVSPLRDVVDLLLIGREFVDAKYHSNFRDLHDHIIRLLESIDMQREMTSSMLEIYLSILNNQMNETMKVLTIFSSIFIPLTFITGLYGMNFSVMPGLQSRYGYWVVLVVMFTLASGMLYFFRRKRML